MLMSKRFEVLFVELGVFDSLKCNANNTVDEFNIDDVAIIISALKAQEEFAKSMKLLKFD